MVSSVNALASSFESLEKGRLSRLEIKVAEMITTTNNKAKNTSIWVSFFVALIVGVTPQIVIYLLTKK